MAAAGRAAEERAAARATAGRVAEKRAVAGRVPEERAAAGRLGCVSRAPPTRAVAPGLVRLPALEDDQERRRGCRTGTPNLRADAYAGEPQRRRGRSRRAASRSARCGDARAHAARHWQSQAQAQHVRRQSRARKQGRQQHTGTLWRGRMQRHMLQRGAGEKRDRRAARTFDNR